MEEKKEKKENDEKKEKIKVSDEYFQILKKIMAPILLFTITMFFFAPLELYISNRSELWIELSDFFWVVLPFFLFVTLFFVIFLGILTKINPKLGGIATVLVFVLGVLFYIEGNFNSVNYPILDGIEFDWTENLLLGGANVALWLGSLLIVFHCYKVKKELYHKAEKIVAFYIIGVQLVTLGFLFATIDFEDSSIAAYPTTVGQFELSKNENIVVFVLDTLDTSYTNGVIEQYPEVTDIFKDFTFYDNVLGAYPMSRESIPFLITGVPFTNQDTYENYKSIATKNSPILETLVENEYELSIFTYYGYIHEDIMDYTENIAPSHLLLEDKVGFLQRYYQFCMYRYAPHYLKQVFYSSNYDFFQYTNFKGDLYSYDNEDFYHRFKEKGLSAEKEAKQYQFYYLWGSHLPYLIDENFHPLEDAINGFDFDAVIAQTRGCFKMVDEYMEEMKELGIYEDSTIVILSDHGFWEDGKSLGMRQCPTVMVKRPNENNETLEISSAPVSYLADWAGTLQTLVNPEGEYGDTFFNIEEGVERLRSYYYSPDLLRPARIIESPTLYVYESTKEAVLFSEEDKTNLIFEAALNS